MQGKGHNPSYKKFTVVTTRTCADQHKCLPLLACVNPTLLLITYVALILTKPGDFFFSAYGNSGYGQNSISSISNFLKKIHISGFPWCSTREDHSIDVSITNVGLILMKLR